MPTVEEMAARLREDPASVAELEKIREQFAALSAPGSEAASCMRALVDRIAEVVPDFRPADAPEALFDQLMDLIVRMTGLMVPWWERIPSAVAEAGLIIPLSQMPPAEFGALLTAHRDGGPDATIAFVRRYYDRLFACPHFLPRLKEAWRADPFLGKRIAPLSDALDAHVARLFGASVPPLIAQLEGLIADISSHKGRMNASEWRSYMTGVASQDPFGGKLVEKFVSNVLAATFEHGQAVSSPLSRHAVLHGGDVAYGTETNSRTAILLVDYFAFVQRVRPVRPAASGS